MFKNKKGFSLIELITVLFIISILLGIAIPNYRTSTMKTRIVNNMALMRALQNDIVNYYDLHGRLPNNILQLSLNKGELTNISTTSATHIPTRCTLTLGASTDPGIEMDCGAGWTMKYSVQTTSLGYRTGPRYFIISSGGASYLNNIANELGWQHSGDSYIIR